MSAVEDFDVVIVGGGSGLTTAYYAEKDGRSIALITDRPDALGGTCINFGCIPTKTLLASAHAADAVRQAPRLGVHVDLDSLQIDFPAIMAAMRKARSDSAAGARRWVESSMSLIVGRAAFVDERTLALPDGRQIRGKRVFLATGSHAAIPPIDGLADIDYWTNQDVLELDACPERLIVIGGGYIGCELGYFFSAMGCDVTLVHPDAVLLAEDEEIGQRFTTYFDPRITRVTGRAIAARENARCKTVTVRLTDGSSDTLEADAVLIATGRRPNTDGLALDKSGIQTDDTGAITVDDHLATTVAGVYAYGDVIGTAPFKHTSSTEGEIAYANAFGEDRLMDYRANPHAVFAVPEVAGVGLTEAECRDRNLSCRSHRLAYNDTARGRIEQAESGLAKLILADDDRILGCHIVGPEAALLLHEVVVAMNAPGAAAEPIRRAIHVHPSLAEVVGTLFDNA